MKSIFLMIIFYSATFNKVQSSVLNYDEELQKRIQECYDNAEVNADQRQSNPMGKLDSPSLKCFSACMMKKKGTMVDGKIYPEKQFRTPTQLDSYDAVKEVVNLCKDLANKGKDECEIAHSYVKCLIKQIHL